VHGPTGVGPAVAFRQRFIYDFYAVGGLFIFSSRDDDPVLTGPKRSTGMSDSLKNIDAKASALVQRRGPVTYNSKGMFAPAGGKSEGPYVTEAALEKALALAREKLAYLLDSRDPAKTADPQSFLDLRDGGDDRRGLPGQPLMTGWLDYAARVLGKPAFLKGLERAGEKIRADFRAFVVIGIGGSYTDTEGVISALSPAGTPVPFYYLGQHLSADAYERFFHHMESLDGKAAVNIISKSGTTVEPALAARLVLDRLKALGKLGAVFATTDPARGALRETAAAEGYNPAQYISPEVAEEFCIGGDIGGRFSCITPVGLFPYAVAGIDVEEFLTGYHLGVTGGRETALGLAALRFAAFSAGATQMVLAYNVSSLRGKILAFRQLWPESTGKAGTGLNVMEEFYTSDAHSNGQLIKSGPRNMMEIFHFVDELPADFPIPRTSHDRDKLNAVAGSLKLHAINNLFMAALLLDHQRSGVPVTAVRLPRLTPFHLGQLTGIEHLTTALFGLMSGVNPVNQPGVQGYKEIAFGLLGLKGRAERDEALRALEEFGL
jgi:glucose-6-phosphate isomerase